MADEVKTSNIKLQFEPNVVEEYVNSKLDGVGSITRLVEGHNSQAFVFTHRNGDKRVMRIASDDEGFIKDKYAFEKFSGDKLPIPRIIEIGDFKNHSYYCVSQFVEGKPSDQLTSEEMVESLENQLFSFAQLFKTNIEDAVGWGEIDVQKERAPYDTWHEPFYEEIENLDESLLINGLVSLGLDKSLYRALQQKFVSNMSQLASPVKRLVHGDLGFDNVLVHKGQTTAIIDWAAIGYGDWVFDMAYCEFWHPGKYGDIRNFGEKFNLDCNQLDQRINACIAFVALTTLNYAINYESDSTKNWLKLHLSEKLH